MDMDMDMDMDMTWSWTTQQSLHMNNMSNTVEKVIYLQMRGYIMYQSRDL